MRYVFADSQSRRASNCKLSQCFNGFEVIREFEEEDQELEKQNN